MQSNLPGSDPYGYPPPRPPPRAVRERGGCLTVWLTVSIAINVLAGFVICNTLSAATNRPGATTVIIFLVGLLVASLTCLWGIWNWKRWGVYGIAVLSIVSPIIESAFSVADSSDWIAPIVQIGILYFLVKDRWDDFE